MGLKNVGDSFVCFTSDTNQEDKTEERQMTKVNKNSLVKIHKKLKYCSQYKFDNRQLFIII